MAFFSSLLTTFACHCRKVQIYNYNIEKECVVNKILYFNFQFNILCDKYLLHNTLYFVIPFSIPTLIMLKYLKCVCLDCPYTFYS